MTRFMLLLLCPAVCLALGCAGPTSGSDAWTAAPHLSAPVPPSASVVPADSANGGDAQPVSRDWRQQRDADAMRGLLYDGDRVRIDEAVAAAIAERGTVELAMAEYENGRDALRHNHRTGALRAFTKAVLIAPEEPIVYQGLGLALAAKGLLREAVIAYETALALDPMLPGARFELAMALHASGRLTDSIAQLNIVVEQEPMNGRAHGRLAIAHYYQGQGADAWYHVHRADELGFAVPPQFRELLNNRHPE